MIKCRYSLNEAVFCLIYFISSAIFFQQVFVINIGGSFKLYEIAALLLCFIFIFYDRPKIYGNLSAILFCFFVVVPTISLLFYLLDDSKYEYYIRFPEAVNSLRTNVIVAPIILLGYYIFCWTFINYTTVSCILYQNKVKLIRIFVITGTIVAIYNIYTYIFCYILQLPDIIPPFLDFRNTPTQVTGRFCGFSSEPGTYIVIQTWVVYYLFFYTKIKIKYIKLIKSINFISLIMTMSSLLIPSLLFFIIQLFKRASYIYKIKIICSLILITISITTLLNKYNLNSVVRYILIEKIQNFLEPSDNTLDSGSYRNFTTRLGLRVFKDNQIIGAGGGTSCFYLWKYEYDMGIKTWGECITATTYPQNSYSKILAELGMSGFLFFISFYIYFLFLCYKHRRDSQLLNVSMYGGLFMLFALTTTYPITSLFLWFNIAIALNTIYHIKYFKKLDRFLD